MLQLGNLFEIFFIGSFLFVFIIAFPIFYRKFGGMSFVISTISGILAPIIFLCVFGIHNDIKDRNEERRRNEIAEEESKYFDKIISGHVDAEDIKKYYKKHKVSYYGIVNISRKLEDVKLIEYEQNKTFYMLIEELSDYPEISARLLLKINFPDIYIINKSIYLVEKLNKRDILGTLSYLAKNKSTPEEALIKIALISDFYVAEYIFKNENASQLVKDIYLIRKSNYDIEFYARSNENRNKINDYKKINNMSAWKIISEDSDEKIRLIAATHPLAPVEVLNVLANDNSDEIKFSVLVNNSTSKFIRNNIAKILKKSIDDIFLSVIKNDKAIDENKLLKKKISIAEYNDELNSAIIRELSNSTNRDLKIAVARRSDLPIDVIGKLAVDNDRWVRKAISDNENIPFAIRKSVQR